MYFDNVDHSHVLEWVREEPYIECWKCSVPKCTYIEKRYIECQ